MFSCEGTPQVVQYSLKRMGRSCSEAGPASAARTPASTSRWQRSSSRSVLATVRMASGVRKRSPGATLFFQWPNSRSARPPLTARFSSLR